MRNLLNKIRIWLGLWFLKMTKEEYYKLPAVSLSGCDCGIAPSHYKNECLPQDEIVMSGYYDNERKMMIKVQREGSK